jgi:hypothetical protein
MSKVVTAEDVVDAKAEIPDGFYESAIIRCTKADFGLSKSSQKPMITLEWEMLGVRDPADPNKILTQIDRNGKTYVLAGLSVRSKYHTLSDKAIKHYKKDWAKYTGEDESKFSCNVENPDLSIFKDLAMSAVVKAVKTFKRKELTDEDKKAGKTQGDIVKDEDGKELSFKTIEIDTLNKRFTGELPAF